MQARCEILLTQNSDLNCSLKRTALECVRAGTLRDFAGAKLGFKCSLKANRARGWSGERSENKGLPLVEGESRSRGILGLPYGRSARKIINKTEI